MLPYQPEPTAALKARYAAALARLYDARVDPECDDDRPGTHRDNCFDFEDGLRLIVSRERITDAKIVIHISASFIPGTEMYESLKKKSRGADKGTTIRQALEEIRHRFATTFGEPRTATFLGMSAEKGVPHWHIEDN